MTESTGLKAELVIDPKSWNDLIAKFNTLGPAVGQRAFAKVIKSGSELIKAEQIKRINTKPTRRMLPDDRVILEKRTGRLIRSMRIRNVTKYRPYFWKAAIGSYRGKTKDDPNGAYYAHMVEYGHKVIINKRNYGDCPPRPFIKAGLDAVQGKIIAQFQSEAKRVLEAAWKRQARAAIRAGKI